MERQFKDPPTPFADIWERCKRGIAVTENTEKRLPYTASTSLSVTTLHQWVKKPVLMLSTPQREQHHTAATVA